MKAHGCPQSVFKSHGGALKQMMHWDNLLLLGFSGSRAGQSTWWQDQHRALTVIMWLNQRFYEQNVSSFFLSWCHTAPQHENLVEFKSHPCSQHYGLPPGWLLPADYDELVQSIQKLS